MSVFPRYLGHLDSGKVDFLQECRRRLSGQYGIDDICWNCVLSCQLHIEEMCYKKIYDVFFSTESCSPGTIYWFEVHPVSC